MVPLITDVRLLLDDAWLSECPNISCFKRTMKCRNIPLYHQKIICTQNRIHLDIPLLNIESTNYMTPVSNKRVWFASLRKPTKRDVSHARL